MTDTVTIGVAQWLPRCNEPDRNMSDALGYIAELSRRGCSLIVLPELWPCGYDPATIGRDARNAAEPLAGPRGQALSAAARTHRVHLFAGTVPERHGEHLYNTAVVYGPDGQLLGAHRKVHLYSPLGEDEVFTAGDEATVVPIDGIGVVGVSTCFDGDHPAYARALHDRGARVVNAPCAYEVATESWWDVLYPANALANGQWWVMANQCGGELLGKSRIIAPDGTIKAEASRVVAGSSAEVLVGKVDLQGGIREAELAAGALWAETRTRVN
jgi:predicted amidohydrolase